MRKYLLVSAALVASLVLTARPCSAQAAEPSLKQTMDEVVKRLYASMDEKALAALNNKSALSLFSDQERKVLATKYWTFDVNVPVVVSVIRNVDQPVTPFWLEDRDFEKTDLIVKNEEWSYEVWQKKLNAGHVELGINGFDMHRTVYFVCVGPQQPGAKVKITDLFPPGEAVITMKKGAWTYRDWDDLYIEDLPESLRASTDIVRTGLPNMAGMTMADVEKLHIMNTLRMFGGNREKTAKALGIGARTLYRKLRDYGLR